MTTPLYHAIRTKHEDAVRLLVESGADINKRYSETDCPTVWYACWNNKDMIRLLVELGLDVNSCDDRGSMFIHSVWNSNTYMMKILLANGAHIDSDWDNYTTNHSHDVIDLVRDFQSGIISRDDLYREAYGCLPS